MPRLTSPTPLLIPSRSPPSPWNRSPTNPNSLPTTPRLSTPTRLISAPVTRKAQIHSEYRQSGKRPTSQTAAIVLGAGGEEYFEMGDGEREEQGLMGDDKSVSRYSIYTASELKKLDTSLVLWMDRLSTEHNLSESLSEEEDAPSLSLSRSSSESSTSALSFGSPRTSTPFKTFSLDPWSPPPPSSPLVQPPTASFLSIDPFPTTELDLELDGDGGEWEFVSPSTPKSKQGPFHPTTTTFSLIKPRPTVDVHSPAPAMPASKGETSSVTSSKRRILRRVRSGTDPSFWSRKKKDSMKVKEEKGKRRMSG